MGEGEVIDCWQGIGYGNEEWGIVGGEWVGEICKGRYTRHPGQGKGYSHAHS